MNELTRSQIQRQDDVDNAIRVLLITLGGEQPWNIEDIGMVRDAVAQVVLAKTGTPLAVFYPYLEEN